MTERPAGPDGKNFERLVREHGDRAYRFALRLAGNEADARDLVQESFARAFRSREAYDAGRPFEAWLLRMLRNVYLDGVRRYERRHGVSLDAAPAEEGDTFAALLPDGRPDPSQELDARDRDRAVRRALGSLPLIYRTAVVLNDIEGLTYEQIARVMDCPVGTVRSRIFQGRTLLRKAFSTWEERP
jgi:RNA polymerase sigma-70 factor (ECF subfamily)